MGMMIEDWQELTALLCVGFALAFLVLSRIRARRAQAPCGSASGCPVLLLRFPAARREKLRKPHRAGD
jgi:hypothetical protein